MGGNSPVSFDINTLLPDIFATTPDTCKMYPRNFKSPVFCKTCVSFAIEKVVVANRKITLKAVFIINLITN